MIHTVNELVMLVRLIMPIEDAKVVAAEVPIDKQ